MVEELKVAKATAHNGGMSGSASPLREMCSLSSPHLLAKVSLSGRIIQP